MHTYQNPVIKGFNPDPSICRVGEDFFLVTSTFEYFPGVPVYHSKNLADWNLIGHCLTRREQLELGGARPSGGIYAPTIRHHNGLFYMTTTNVSHRGNFIVTARDPAGPWSDPVWIRQGGIDPSLFFDADGAVYFTSTGSDEGEGGIFLCSLHPETLEQQTKSVRLTEGSGGRFIEAPHLYKFGKYYYLLLAEGGTEFGHMVTVFRSRSVSGPYESCPHNPILSHRGAPAQNSPIQCTGHADLTDDQNGNWWMVALATRPLPGVMLHNLGRETFLAPVTWEDDWPVVKNPLSLSMSAPLPAAPEGRDGDFTDDFTASKPEYVSIRNPDPSRIIRDAGAKTLTLRGNSAALRDADGEPPVFLGIRQTEFSMVAEVEVSVPADGATGGLAAYYGPGYHYAVYLSNGNGQIFAQALRRVHEIEEVSKPLPLSGQSAKLRIVTGSDVYRLGIADENGAFTELARGVSAGLCTEGTFSMTFTGTMLGMFCESGEAVFRGFSVREGVSPLRVGD